LRYYREAGGVSLIGQNERPNINDSPYPAIKHLVNPIMTACLVAIRSSKYSTEIAKKKQLLGLELYSLLNGDSFYQDWYKDNKPGY
jgi:hypothetical protein